MYKNAKIYPQKNYVLPDLHIKSKDDLKQGSPFPSLDFPNGCTDAKPGEFWALQIFRAFVNRFFVDFFV